MMVTFPHGGAAQIWRDGSPTPYNPDKAEIRDWGESVEGAMTLTETLQRISNSINTGFAGSEAFAGAGEPQQGFDILGGKIYATIRTTGATYDIAERCRIVEVAWTDNGGALVPTIYSPELNIGHGQDVTGLVSGGTTYLYTTLKTATSGNAGKGYSKIQWAGAGTTQGHVSEFQLFGDAGSGHRFENYFEATVAVSTDASGKYVLLAPNRDGGSGNAGDVLIYDRAAVEAAADPLTIDPVYQWPQHVLPFYDGKILQGMACDGARVWLAYGSWGPELIKYLVELTMTGNVVSVTPITGIMDSYGTAGVRDNATKGIMQRSEVEGLCVRDGRVFVGYHSAFVDDADIVTATLDGVAVNLGCIVDDAASDNPMDGRYWTQTELAATAGAWTSGNSYSTGSNYTERHKWIVEIGYDSSLSGWFGNRPSEWYRTANTPLSVADGVSDIVYPHSQALNIAAWAPFGGPFGAHYQVMTLTGGEMRLHDPRIGSDDSLYGLIRREATSAVKRLFAEAQDGGRINLWDDDDPTNPGWVQLIARDGVSTDSVNLVPGKGLQPKTIWAPEELITLDGAFSFTPNGTTGFLLIWNKQDAGSPLVPGIVWFDTSGTVACVKIAGGANLAVATGALTGTDGSAGDLTVSAHTDGKIYIENRIAGGFDRVVGYLPIC